MRLIVNSSTEAVEAYRPQDHNHDHEHQAKLWLVDAVIASCEPKANPVVQGTRDGLADDAKYERAQAD